MTFNKNKQLLLEFIELSNDYRQCLKTIETILKAWVIEEQSGEHLPDIIYCLKRVRSELATILKEQIYLLELTDEEYEDYKKRASSLQARERY